MLSMRRSPHMRLCEEALKPAEEIWGNGNEGGGRLTLEVDVMLVRDAEDVVALVRLRGLYKVSLRVFEMHFDPAAGESHQGGWLRDCLPCAGLRACKVPMPYNLDACVRIRIDNQQHVPTCT